MKIKQNALSYFKCMLGAALFAAGFNLFAVPIDIYSGNFTGIAQIIQSAVNSLTGGKVDYTGVFLLLLNIPLLLLAYRLVDRQFFYKTLFTVIIQSVWLLLIPVPARPLLNDPLASCLIGGLIAGYGSGLALRSGGSGGGVDIIAVIVNLRHSIPVGRFSLFIGLGVYAIRFFSGNIEILVYSIIFTSISTFVLDKSFYQSRRVQTIIFTRKPAVSQHILEKYRRGVTYWPATGAFTDAAITTLVCVLSKHEVESLKQELKRLDPDVFMIVSNDVEIVGNYKNNLSV